MIRAALAGSVRLLVGAAPRWQGCGPAAAQRVYFANHTSHLDFLALWSALPGELRNVTRPVAARDYWEATAVKRWLAARVFRAVLIEREHPSRANNPLTPMLAALQAGESLIVFPEGGRQAADELAPFKPGLFHLARAWAAAEFVPVHLGNLNRALPKGELLPVPFCCAATFGSPLRLEPGEGKPAFLARCRGAVLALAEHP